VFVCCLPPPLYLFHFSSIFSCLSPPGVFPCFLP
jgi:hypothetical protein